MSIVLQNINFTKKKQKKEYDLSQENDGIAAWKLLNDSIPLISKRLIILDDTFEFGI